MVVAHHAGVNGPSLECVLCPFASICYRMRPMKFPVRTGIVLAVLLCCLSAGAQVLPKPQITSAAGKLAPDFTLNDQQGKPFHLASLRGKRVLLIFYRGYW